MRMRQMQFGRNKDETYIEKGSGGTAMKKETPEQQLNLLCRLIIRERDNWNYINENSCNDPFWPYGRNKDGSPKKICSAGIHRAGNLWNDSEAAEWRTLHNRSTENRL